MQNQTGELSPESESQKQRRGLLQHKREAWWFYRFLSLVYDRIVNPLHWTEAMREQALQRAELDREDLVTIDVGGGTGFCTEGILRQGIAPSNVTLLDQSPHQLAKAKAKHSLEGVSFLEGDAEHLSFETDSVDRYVSAGSIEYWPEPQRGITEAYRVLKPGGRATLIGPTEARHPVSHAVSSLWMNFPNEEDYREWFEAAGFRDIEVTQLCPAHFRGVRQHGLIMGLVITAIKPQSGRSPLELGPMEESSCVTETGKKVSTSRLLLGSLAGFYYFLLPFALILGVTRYVLFDES